MKLVDILALELKVWPEGLECLSQIKGTGYIINGKGFDGRAFDALQIADETLVAGAIVTRAEWQAAVDALNAPKVVEWEQGDIPPIGEPCEAYVLAETEKQDPPMNRWISGKFTGKALSDNGGIILLVECEDGWTHAINAFSYVRPPRTAEQVAAEEREAEDNEVMSRYMSLSDCQKGILGHSPERAIIGLMRVMGYRKDPKQCGS